MSERLYRRLCGHNVGRSSVAPLAWQQSHYYYCSNNASFMDTDIWIPYIFHMAQTITLWFHSLLPSTPPLLKNAKLFLAGGPWKQAVGYIRISENFFKVIPPWVWIHPAWGSPQMCISNKFPADVKLLGCLTLRTAVFLLGRWSPRGLWIDCLSWLSYRYKPSQVWD